MFLLLFFFFFFFFFQAEDGIRDWSVTGVQTCALPIAGQSVEAVYVSVAERDLFAIGLNCATGPDFMTDHLRTLAQISRFPVSCFPNAGLPDEEEIGRAHV